jgi:hypothetical protein
MRLLVLSTLVQNNGNVIAMLLSKASTLFGLGTRSILGMEQIAEPVLAMTERGIFVSNHMDLRGCTYPPPHTSVLSLANTRRTLGRLFHAMPCRPLQTTVPFPFP